jgi:hypothetical protein
VCCMNVYTETKREESDIFNSDTHIFTICVCFSFFCTHSPMFRAKHLSRRHFLNWQRSPKYVRKLPSLMWGLASNCSIFFVVVVTCWLSIVHNWYYIYIYIYFFFSLLHRWIRKMKKKKNFNRGQKSSYDTEAIDIKDFLCQIGMIYESWTYLLFKNQKCFKGDEKLFFQQLFWMCVTAPRTDKTRQFALIIFVIVASFLIALLTLCIKIDYQFDEV